MRLPLRLAACLFLAIVCAAPPCGAVPRDYSVEFTVVTAGVPPHLTLNWNQRLPSNVSAQRILRRLKGETTWVQQATLTTSQTSYPDLTALPNVEYEYWLEQTMTGVSPNRTMGYLSAGVNVPAAENRGTLLLVVDDTMSGPLAPEIAQLRADLAADGWTVQTIIAPRSGTAVSTKALIKAAYDAAPASVKMVYLLGQVPVPYSGLIAPDGHGDHYGAWPADGYYGDMNGTWTDATVNNITASRTQNQNIPGDGKFDQSTLPSALELMVGRVHMRGMTKAPAAAVSETTLLRRYLRKAHDYRYRLGAYANIPRRTLLRDGFGQFSGEVFAISGWQWGNTGVATPPVAPIFDEPPSGQWWNFAAANSYLLGYGCGGGSYESAGSVGNSLDFGRKASKVVFTSLFGSYHGDWDADNNFMRAPLAGTATGDSLGLTCMWAGRPHWYMHHMGMGEAIGYSARISMNASAALAGGVGYQPPGSSQSGVHTGLMGDPSLRLHMVMPPRNLTAISANGQVTLNWTAVTETALQGYHVYRANTLGGPFTRLTTTPINVTNYSDATGTPGQAYTYAVRTLKLETVPGGTYLNLSQGELATLTVNAGATPAPANPTNLSVVQFSAVNGQLIWKDNSSNETGFRIERQVNTGAYTGIATVGQNAITYNDPGPFTQGSVYYYRVVAQGAGGDSVASNEVSFDATPGFFDFSSTTTKVDKTAGVASIPVSRFGGLHGAVSIGYSVNNNSALAGVHYAATSGTLTWADGETGPQQINVPLTNTGTPQLPRQFTVSLANPTGGAALAQWTSHAVLITDPTATLTSAWSSTMIGTVTDSAPAVEAEGAIGGAQIGGSGLTAADTADAGRFIYQQRSGDGEMIAFVPAASPAQTAARFAIMARGTLLADAQFAAAVTSGDATGYGAKLAYRTITAGALAQLPAANNAEITPRWLKLTRFGNTFTAESSANGTSWITLATTTVALPANAYWGLYHSSADIASNYTADYQLGAFSNVSLGPLPPPAAPAGFSANYAASGTPYNNLAWSATRYMTGYRIERRAEGEANFSLLTSPAANATSHADTAIAPDTAYEYRLIAYNGSGDATSQPIARATTPPADAVLNLPALADAAVRADSPSGALGADSTIRVSGSDVATASLNTVAKSWLRFDLSGLPTLKTARIKLGVVSHNLQPTFTAGKSFSSSFRMLQESSDTWDENTLTWSNAPQNDTAGLLVTPTFYNLGNYTLANAGVVPAPGTVASIPLSASLINTNKGANNLVTIALVPGGQCGPIDFASREQGTLSAPALELTYVNALTRPSFLTATPGAVAGIGLGWLDNAGSEAGYRLERRPAGGVFAALPDLAANTTTYTDLSATPGVAYEYRLRATGAPGDSAWSLSAAATAPPFTYDYWLQANGLPANSPPDAMLKGDGLSNLMKCALGLPPSTIGSAGRLQYGTVNVSGADYLFDHLYPARASADGY